MKNLKVRETRRKVAEYLLDFERIVHDTEHLDITQNEVEMIKEDICEILAEGLLS
jgi:hypothetical protein